MRLSCTMLFIWCLGSILMCAQECPNEDPDGPSKESVSRTLKGKVVYHDEIRKWFGLAVDSPVCGQGEIQLIPRKDDTGYRSIKVFRGCRATVEGVLGIAGTVYYSTDIYQSAEKIVAEDGCALRPEMPDYSNAKPERSIRRYHVGMRMDYSARGGKIEIRVHSGNRLLAPWPAYTSYTLTGGYAFYASCAENFSLSHLRGTLQAHPWTMENQAMLDPESAAVKHVRWIKLAFNCSR